MKWMEFIKVQTARPHVAEELLDFLAECKKHHGLIEIKVYQHALVDDCAFCLFWDTDQPELQDSTIGLHLTNSLKKYGLVDRSVWIEKYEGEEEKK